MGREDPMGGSVRVDLYGLSRAQDGGAAILGDRLMGTCVGDSRLYVIPEVGPPRIPTEGAAKGRLGSGPVHPFLVHERLKTGDLLLLMSDGAWTPLALAKLQALRLRGLQGHPSDVPALILDASGRGAARTT